ncbi:MAG: DVUA0089 family protein [Proteobacteria bacterium]|nr:DVUA0089 family protein [Pseudomonadota bacterium]
MRKLPTALLASLALLAPISLIGCATDDAKGEEDELPPDGKADTLRKPTEHGDIAFQTPATSELTTAEHFHAWTFELSAAAAVEMTTSYAVLGQRKTDTVLYLYKESPTGWGAYVARNDDYGTSVYSQIKRTLEAGRYRVLVKGFASTTRGKFSLTVGCTGAGCSAPTTSCVFGQTYGDIATTAGLQITNTNTITPATLPQLTAVDRDRLVRAVQQSSHTDVTTAEEALGRVDQQEMNISWIVEPAARRTFVAFEYGAGDNSYGAVFDQETSAMVTNIHDGDLEHCTTAAATCLLPEDWTAMRADPAFTQTATRVVRAAAELTALETTQALAAFRRTYADVTSVADGLSRVDDNQVNVVSFTHASTGTALTVVEYGAGDTSIGAIYYAGTTQLAGAISDLFIGSCTFLVY